MLISIVNHSSTISNSELQEVVRALNRQIKEDFEPHWGFGATLRVDGNVGSKTDSKYLPDRRGDSVIYLDDGTNSDGIEGVHDVSEYEIPYGMVSLGLCAQVGDNWTVTLSHEILELIGDPMINLMVEGPHPFDKRKKVFHMFEMCDAVQAETYKIDGIEVSNFVLPSYFTVGEAEGTRNDFLGIPFKGKLLKSFGLKPGGYVNVFDAKAGKWDQPVLPDDGVALARKKAKAASKHGRSNKRINKP